MCRAAITDGNAFFPAATAICQSRQEHTRHILQQISARLTARWRRSPAALAVTSRAVTLHVRFRSPERRERFHAPPPAPAGDMRRCMPLHGRVYTPTCGAGTPARGPGPHAGLAATRVESRSRPRTRFSRGRAGTCRGRGHLVDATEHHGFVHWSQDRGSQRDDRREVVTGICARSVRSSLYVLAEGCCKHHVSTLETLKTDFLHLSPGLVKKPKMVYKI